MNKYATQGRCLIEALKRKPHTYMEMLAHGVSTAPWKRVAESLAEDEQIRKSTRAVYVNGEVRHLTTWSVKKA